MTAESTKATLAWVPWAKVAMPDRKTIRVILLRHGEREDETEDYDERHHSYQERIDPALTKVGHQQALHAWQKILSCLPTEKPVVVASSPLRRCLGTAMMVAAAFPPGSPIRFVLPSHPNKPLEELSDTTIPVLVVNGLGDCAAQMRRMGGIGKVVKAGWLQCAASPGNDWIPTSPPKDLQQESITPIQKCLPYICGRGAVVLSKEQPTRGTKIQFWRESQYHYHQQLPKHHVVPLTNAQTLFDHSAPLLVDSPSLTVLQSSSSNNSHPPKMPKNAPSRDESCHKALERAVLQTALSGLETCILVTHREAIRFVEDNWSHTHPNKRATKLYCCIAVYHVTVDLVNRQIIQWKSVDVVPYQLLKPESMGIGFV